MNRLLLLLVCLSGSISAEEVYREIGEDGVPVFSDQKLPGGEVIEVREPMTFTDPIIKDLLYKKHEEEQPEEKAVTYKLSIDQPASGAAIRDNAGNLTLQVSISPLPQPGHVAELLKDGFAFRKLNSSGEVFLTNVDRGTHAFSLRVSDADGKVISESDTTTVTLLRFSKQH